MRRLLILIYFLSLHPVSDSLSAETPPAQEEAIKALKGITSNLQKNRDGTVRFVRFSKSIVTDEHVAQVAAFKQLDYLAVVTPTVGDEGLNAIAGLTNLDTLYLSDSNITDATMPNLVRLEKLEKLYLDRTAITDAGLTHISNLTTLKTLSLAGTSITDNGLEHLSQLENLEVLILNETSITDEGMESLAKLPNLKSLELERTNLTGDGLNHLCGLEKLEVLSLRGIQLEPKVLLVLSECKQLQKLLLGETDLTIKDVQQLTSDQPKLHVNLSPEPDQEMSVFHRFLASRTTTDSTGSKKEAFSKKEAQLPEKADPAIHEFIATKTATPSFQKHVLPLLGRLGCNGRTCHGSFQGQGGFSLSMFGYDFEADHTAITGGDEPRVDLENPDESLFLHMPTHGDEHGGGQRFEIDGWEHQLLRRWILSGAKGIAKETGPEKIVRFEVVPSEITFSKPGETVQLKCVAIWESGSREDVTQLTRYRCNDETIAEVTIDGLITCKSPGDTNVISFYDNIVSSVPVLLPVSDQIADRFPHVETPTEIDKFVTTKLKKLGIVPSELSTDEEFLRRVSLDLIGTLPTPEEIEAFLADKSDEKRKRKIDELLESPAYADWWAIQFADITGSNSQYLGSTDMNTPAANQWNAWIRRRVQDNVGWDKIAAGIILASSRRPGQSYAEYVAEQSLFLRREEPEDFTSHDNPMHYYWFRSNNQLPKDRALSFAYVFLGVRLQCAQCHKHPFDQWSKQDFEKFTQFFTRVKTGIAPDARQSQTQLKSKLGVPVKLDTAALRRQMYLRVSAEGLPIPWNEVWIEEPGEKPQISKLLGGEEIDLSDYDDPREPLMNWLVSEDNPYFANAFVNRIWSHYFGVGIVDPPDDFNLANPPSNKALLEWLRTEFVAHGYDIKWLHRTITNSRTYQLSWKPNESNRNDERNFSHALIRRLPAEVTIDSILQATSNKARLKTWSSDTSGRKITQHPKSIQARGIDYSLLVFGKPLRTTNCDCERQLQPTLLQSLYVRNDHEVLGWLERKDGWLSETARQLGESLSSEATTTHASTPKTIRPSKEAPDLDGLIQEAYLRSLSRHPTESELQRIRRHLKESENTIEGLRDLMWVLLNTQEFLTNH